ncbi:MAG: flippase [Patescibacteria group bacterium]
MPYGSKVAKNAAWLMLATTGQKVLAFFSFIIVARLSGTDITGAYFYAISITSIFVTFADLGMTPVVIRAISGHREDGDRLLGAAIRAKGLLAPLASLGAMLFALLAGGDATIIATVGIACLVMTADSIHLVIYGALRGKQNLRPEAIGMFIGQSLSAVTAASAAYFKTGPVGLAVALLLSSVWNVGWSLYQAKRLKVIAAEPRKSDFRVLAREAIPFGLAGMAVKVYSYVDSLFLKHFHGVTDVGVYAVAYKLTYALQFLPLTFTAALYPALSAAFAKGEKEDVRNTFLGALRLMAAVGFVLTAGVSALAPRIIPLIYGEEFIAAVPALSVLPWVLLPIFMDFPIGALLNASHRAHLKTTAMLCTMVLNILLNLFLVPLFGPVGAAWAGVISFWSLYLIGVGFIAGSVGGAGRLLWLTARALISAVVAWIAWRMIGGRMDLFASMCFGGAISVVMAFATRLVTVDDVFGIWKRFRPSTKLEDIHE